MKQQTNRWFFPLLSLGLGLLAGGCRFMLYAAGLYGKGLILAHHPAAIALWILTGLACAAAAASASAFSLAIRSASSAARLSSSSFAS